MITCNISKALLHSRGTLLYRNPKASSSRSVLPVVTPYSSEGRQFSKSVQDHWHIIENDSQLHSIWPNPPITAYHKTESLKDILVHSHQAKTTSLCSAPINNNDWHLNDHYATLSQPTHTSQLAHPLWNRSLNTPHGLFHEPKAHLNVIVVTHFMVFDTMSHPSFFRVTKIC